MKQFLAVIFFGLILSFGVQAQPMQAMSAGPGNIDPCTQLFTGAEVIAGLPYSFSVSPTGAALVQIPIDVSPGTAGMQPDLSLVYNSQSGSGLLGKGWSLSGLSAITRIGQTPERDGKFLGVKLDTSDRFALDGNRLLKKNGNDSVFETEVPTFSDIQSHGYFSWRADPEYFIVRSKDGRTAYYGTLGDARFGFFGYRVMGQWNINKVEDVYGNYMEYEYDNIHSKSIRVKEIRYTGNRSKSISPYNKVKFNYILKNAPWARYIGSTSYGSQELAYEDFLLSGIEVYCEDRLVWQYKFEYDENLETLLSVSKQDPQGLAIAVHENAWSLKSDNFFDHTTKVLDDYGRMSLNRKFIDYEIDFNPITRQYDTIMKTTIIHWGPRSAPRMLADVNGDGKADIVAFGYDTVWVSLSTGEGFLPREKWFAFKSLTDYRGFAPGQNLYYCMDVNGDGLADILWIDNIDVKVALSTGSGFDYALNYKHDGFGINSWGDRDSKYVRFVTDINGDGLPDIVGFGHNAIAYTFNQGNGFKKDTAQPFFDSDNGFPKSDGECQFFVADVDGDGLKDLVCIKGNIVKKYDATGIFLKKKYTRADYVYVAFNNGNNFDSPTRHCTFQRDHIIHAESEDEIEKIENVQVEDLNGDGRSEIVFFTADGVRVYVYNGDKFEDRGIWSNNFKWVGADSFKEHPRFITDLDGNGIPEILSFGTDNVMIHKNLSRDPVKDTVVRYYSLGFCYDDGGWRTDSHIRTLGDVNGDGIQDIVGFGEHAVYVAFGKAATQQLCGIKNEERLKLKINSTKLSVDPHVYKANHGLQYPYMNFNGPLTVVKSVETPDGREGWFSTNYSYEGARFHQKGKGFLGFTKTAVWNTNSNTIDSTEYMLLPQSLSPVVKRTSSYVYSSGEKISEKEIVFYGEQQLSNKRYLVQKITSKEQNHLKGFGTVHLRQEYDSCGNLVLSRTAVPAGTASDVTMENYTYIPRTAQGIPYLLQKKTTVFTPVEKTDPIIRDYITCDSFSYNSKGALIHSMRLDRNGNIIKNILFTYNGSTGLKTSVSEYGDTVNYADRVENYSYDSNWRFCIKSYNAQGGQERTYDNATGALLSVKGITNGLQEHYQYNKYGELVKSVSPTGLTTTYSKYYAQRHPGCDHPYDAHYYIVTKEDGQPTVTVFYDILGRELRTVSQSLAGTVYADTYYNFKGKLGKKSAPYLKGGAPDWTTYYYDSLLRVNAVQQTNGNYTFIAYDKNKTINRDAFGTRITHTNIYGDVTKVEELNPDSTINEITYKYCAPGKASEIKAAGVITKIGYDEFLRKVELTDPDAGIIRYEYDWEGNITSQTDARGFITGNTYDAYGRLAARREANVAINYYYIDTGYNKGKIAKITKGSSTAQEFTYDRYGRQQSISEIIDSLRMTTSYSYDSLGRLKAHTYPSGHVLSYTYDNNSNIINMHYDNQQVWRLDSVNNYNQITKALYGSNMRMEITYHDHKGGRNMKTQNFYVDNTPVYDYEYSFSGSIGLWNRKDRMTKPNQVESFIYDKTNRLTSTIDGISTVYDKNGNIIYKHPLGAYTYEEGSKPHAVKAVSNDDAYTFDQTLTYTATGKVNTISDGMARSARFWYGVDDQRIRMTKSRNGSLILTRHYSMNYELDNDTLHRDYIHTPSGLTAIAQNGKLYYVVTDYQGSIMLVLDSAGREKNRLSYDAWGRRRHPLNWRSTYLDDSRYTPMFDRGYTGHEHLDEFDIINMNGRLYNPTLGRFLSPDPYVADNTYSQDFNRYSYCRNNPMKYTDPSGEFIWLLPNIGWSREGGLSLGLSFVVGIPGGMSGQVGIGYNFKSEEPYAYAGASFMFNTVYGSISPSGGYSVGYSAGMSIFSGFPISSNFTTVGVNYNVTNNSWSGNFSAWDINKNGVTFNPSFSMVVFPERTTNFARGKGFRTNDQVLNDFASNKYNTCADDYVWQNDALKYWGFEGSYDPEYRDVGGYDPKTNKILYSSFAFSGNYDLLNFVASEEAFHKRDVLSGNYKGIDWTKESLERTLALSEGEYKAGLYQYKKQGLFRNHGRHTELMKQIQNRGDMIGKPLFIEPRYKFIYKIPRLW